jgi:AcrR family transcriptional regulator/DNA-binding MarR family transcriptional regulator
MAARKRASGSARRGSEKGAVGDGGSALRAYNGAARGQLADLQRARMLGAMFDLAAERGAGSVTVAHVVERSGVSRRTFYELFSDCEDCLHAAFEQALTYASERVLPAYESEKAWRERIRAGLVALLGFFDEEPVIGRLLIVESHAGGEATSERRGEVLAALTAAVQEGRAEGKASVAPPSLTAEGVVGGVLSVIHARLTEKTHTQRAHGEPLVELTNPLMSMIVLPYLGAGAARRELERPTPAPSARREGEALLSDPFKDAGMRLTYRTVRVLMAIAQSPQASNRQVGETAGITDQGQISKLLGRLERIDLASNTAIHPGKGAPNSWALTDKGRRIAESIRANAAGEAR